MPASPSPPAGFAEVGADLGLTRTVRSGSGEKGHIRETLGQGACWLDLERDGDLDLFVANGARAMTATSGGGEEPPEPWAFYVFDRGRFVDRAAEVGAAATAWGMGCAVGDVDGDGFDDLLVTTAAGSDRLLHNRGDGRFEDWTERSGLTAPGLSASAAFGDVDGDGDLDLFVTAYLDESRPPAGTTCRWKGVPVTCGPEGFPPLDDRLYLNDGGGRFTPVGAEAGISGRPGYGLGVLTLDADGDGDLDLFVGNDSTPNRLLVNRGDARFEDAGLRSGVALSVSGTSQAAMGVDAGDLDGDGREDLVVTNFSDDVHNFYRNDGGGFFTEWSQRSGLAAASFDKLGWAVLTEDFDLDGDLDLFFANGHVYPEVDEHDPNTSYLQPLQLLFNDGRGGLSEDRDRVGPAFRRMVAARGAAAADFDRDGDADLAVVLDGEPPLLLRNDLPAAGATWVRIALEGPPGNPHGLGARVEVEAGGRRQVRAVRAARGYLSSSEPVAGFGLGGAPAVERLTVRWPDGTTSVDSGLEAGRTWVVHHGEPAGEGVTAAAPAP